MLNYQSDRRAGLCAVLALPLLLLRPMNVLPLIVAATTFAAAERDLDHLVDRALANWSASRVELRDARLYCGSGTTAPDKRWLDVADRCRTLRARLLPILTRAIQNQTGAPRDASIAAAMTILDARPRRNLESGKVPAYADDLAVVVAARAPEPMRLPEATLLGGAP